MTTTPEPTAEPVDVIADAGQTKRPFYRRPLALIIAGAVVAVLIVGGLLGYVISNATHPGHLAAVASSASKTHSTPSPSAKPKVTPVATATATPPPADGTTAADPAAPAPAAPVAAAPAAPAAPAPAGPVTAGPSRTAAAPVITNFNLVSNADCNKTGETDGSSHLIVLGWASTGGTGASMTLKGISTEGGIITSAVVTSLQGPRSFSEPCSLKSVQFTLTITAKVGLTAKSTTATVQTSTTY